MDNLPPWAVSIAAVAVGVTPGLAPLAARPIARLLHLALWPRPQIAPGGALASRPATNRSGLLLHLGEAVDGLLTASALDSPRQGQRAITT